MVISILLILFAVLLSGLIIFTHEFGRFFMAELSGTYVSEFAIGVGPTLFYFQKGETQYSLCLLPIGGYCIMEEEDKSSEDNRAFGDKPVQRRIITVCVGAIMNILFGIVLMMALLVQQPMSTSTTIAQFAEGSALQKVSTRTSGRFYSIGDYRVRTDHDPSFSLATTDLQSINISMVREDEKLMLRDVKMNTHQDGDEQVMVPDFYASGTERNPVTLIQRSGTDTISIVRMVRYSLAGLMTGQLGLNDIVRPIGAADATSQAVPMGPREGILPAVNNTTMMMAMIAVNLGVVSLLPPPAPDGGRLIFLLTELAHRRPINPKYEGWIHAAGSMLLVTFIITVTYSDVLRLFTEKGSEA